MKNSKAIHVDSYSKKKFFLIVIVLCDSIFFVKTVQLTPPFFYNYCGVKSGQNRFFQLRT